MEATNLRRDLVQCWLAKTIVQVLERVSREDNYLLVSLGDAVVREEGRFLSGLIEGSLRRKERFHDSFGTDSECYQYVYSLDELQQWTSRTAAQAASKDGVLVVVYAPCASNDAVNQVPELMQRLGATWTHSFLLVLYNPMAIVGADSRADKRGYHLSPLDPTETWKQWHQSLTFIAEPFQSLHEQCGWHFMMEIVRLILECSGKQLVANEVVGRARCRLFSAIEQLPFQLLLLVLRWSHFHPQLDHACGFKFHRQLHLIPQLRVRKELVELEKRGKQLWSHVYPLSEAVKPRAKATQATFSSLVSQLSPPSRGLSSPQLDRISTCHLWKTQKQFYKDQGIHAWSSGAIPYGVSSSSFLAAAYARTAIDFLLSHADSCEKNKTSPNCFVWEAASGSCKFLHAFLLHFTDLLDANDEFPQRGLVPLIVATDLSAQVLRSRAQMACFQPFLARGLLDFALFDTHHFVQGAAVPFSGKRKTLELLHSHRLWHVGTDGPVVLMGNYFFDSLRVDVFPVVQHDKNERVVLYEALLDKDTSSIAAMDVMLTPVLDPSTQAVYQDPRLNATLVQVLNLFQSRWNSSEEEEECMPRTGLILFPVEAFEFFLTLFETESAAFPIALLAGDATYSFRDGISSAFIETKTSSGERKTAFTSLHLPQLSPHPDCFCLPVDLELFQVFFDLLDRTSSLYSTSSRLVSAPATDTFSVLYTILEPKPHVSTPPSLTSTCDSKHATFLHQFTCMTPGDCDLVWGMMSFDDDAARSFSIDALLALVAQSAWDFDLFAVLQWELLSRWRRQAINATSKKVYQTSLIEAGRKAWRTFYYIHHQVETEITAPNLRLQLARWFYALQAYENVVELLTPWQDKKNSLASTDVNVFYLLGLTNLHIKQHWQALSCFRFCARCFPTKVKYQRQIARTLLALQAVRSASSECIERDLACFSSQSR